jgi:hypothetical protein
MTPEQAADRGFRAQSALDDFVGPACAELSQEYLSALTKLAVNEPWETAKITKLAVAQRVIAAVEQHLRTAIMAGRSAKAEIDRAKQIQAIPEARRKYF